MNNRHADVASAYHNYAQSKSPQWVTLAIMP